MSAKKRDPMLMQDIAESVTTRLLSLSPAERGVDLVHLKETNPIVHALVIGNLEYLQQAGVKVG